MNDGKNLRTDRDVGDLVGATGPVETTTKRVETLFSRCLLQTGNNLPHTAPFPSVNPQNENQKNTLISLCIINIRS